VAYKPDVNGYVAVDTIDHRWPDHMGDQKADPEVFGAWHFGHLGPGAWPESLEWAYQHSWGAAGRRSVPLQHHQQLLRAAVRWLGAAATSSMSTTSWRRCSGTSCAYQSPSGYRALFHSRSGILQEESGCEQVAKPMLRPRPKSTASASACSRIAFASFSAVLVFPAAKSCAILASDAFGIAAIARLRAARQAVLLKNEGGLCNFYRKGTFEGAPNGDHALAGLWDYGARLNFLATGKAAIPSAKVAYGAAHEQQLSTFEVANVGMAVVG
jgi:hypothetical protein